MLPHSIKVQLDCKYYSLCVLVIMISHLCVLTEHIEPEDRRPGTLLLAGVGDDDHRERGGLGWGPGITINTVI